MLAGRRFGRKDTPEARSGPVVILSGPKGKRTVRINGPVAANSIGALTRLAAAGLGVAALPDYRNDPVIEELSVILPEWSVGDAPVHLVYPARSLMPARLTAFIADVVSEVEAGRLPPF